MMGTFWKFSCLLLCFNGLRSCSTMVQECESRESEQSNAFKKQRQASSGFRAVKGLFVQEQTSAALHSPGQQPQFGALKPWPEIHQNILPGRKLIFLIRHGEAIHNVVQAYVGEEEWATVSQECFWTNLSNGKTWQLYDPPLTERGVNQATALHQLLQYGETKFQDLTGMQPHATVVSPLTRTLQTYTACLGSWVAPKDIQVDEFCRERFGHNTCDARSPVEACHDLDAPPSSSGPSQELGHGITCKASQNLQDVFPNIRFSISGQGPGLGLVSNTDIWWKSDQRESDGEIVQRAEDFLERLYESVDESIVFVVTHSGFLSAVLEAVGREPYSAVNAELVPVLIERTDTVVV